MKIKEITNWNPVAGANRAEIEVTLPFGFSGNVAELDEGWFLTLRHRELIVGAKLYGSEKEAREGFPEMLRDLLVLAFFKEEK